jgi:hypothetical protein
MSRSYVETRDIGYYWEIVMGPSKHRITMRGHPENADRAITEVQNAQDEIIKLLEPPVEEKQDESNEVST